jgi:hypothetical protein
MAPLLSPPPALLLPGTLEAVFDGDAEPVAVGVSNVIV